jgi:hypothetical protein
MSLPLPDLTFYRLPDFQPTGSLTISLKEAICNSLRSTTDYRGVSVPSTHLWTELSHSSNTATSFYSPTNDDGKRCGITFLGSDAAVTPTMLTPDTFSTNILLLGLTKNVGNSTPISDDNYLTKPFAGSIEYFSGYSAITPAAARATTTRCRAYVSQEAIFINIFTDFATPYWSYIGAIIEPINSYNDTQHNYIPAAESDDRIYGKTTSGTTTVSNAFLSTSPTLFVHSVTSFANHCNIFQPNSFSILNNIRRRLVTTGQYNAGEQKDLAGNWVFDNFEIVRSSLYRLGNSRGIFALGIPSAGQTIIRQGATDLYHVISEDQSGASATQAFVLKAAA